MSIITTISIKVKDSVIKNSNNEKLLAVTVDANLNFNCHLEIIFEKASKKFQVSTRIILFMSIPKKKKMLINPFSDVNITTLYSSNTSSFEKLLEKDGSVNVHTRNLKTFATEMFKVHKTFSPAILAVLFHVWQNNYNLRHNSYFAMPNVKYR